MHIIETTYDFIVRSMKPITSYVLLQKEKKHTSKKYPVHCYRGNF